MNSLSAILVSPFTNSFTQTTHNTQVMILVNSWTCPKEFIVHDSTQSIRSIDQLYPSWMRRSNTHLLNSAFHDRLIIRNQSFTDVVRSEIKLLLSYKTRNWIYISLNISDLPDSKYGIPKLYYTETHEHISGSHAVIFEII